MMRPTVVFYLLLGTHCIIGMHFVVHDRQFHSEYILQCVCSAKTLKYDKTYVKQLWALPNSMIL